MDSAAENIKRLRKTGNNRIAARRLHPATDRERRCEEPRNSSGQQKITTIHGGELIDCDAAEAASERALAAGSHFVNVNESEVRSLLVEFRAVIVPSPERSGIRRQRRRRDGVSMNERIVYSAVVTIDN